MVAKRLVLGRKILLLLLLAVLVSTVQGVEVSDNFYPEKLIAPLPSGVLGRPFGESVVVQGKVVEGPFKGEGSDGRLLVQRINGVATQQGVVIRFDPIPPGERMQGEYLQGEKLWRAQEKKLQAMLGKSFEMRGYEYGAHSGGTSEEMWTLQEDVQNSGFGFRLYFKTLMSKAIPEVHFTPADFSGRVAEFEGRAESRDGGSWLVGADGSALRIHDGAWPADVERLQVWAKGRVAQTAAGIWSLEDADSRLVELADQLGRKVKLDGQARAWNNDVWWFEYRGVSLYVENQKDLPGWKDELAWENLTISGILERATLPDLDQFTLHTDPALKECYIVRHASWSPLDLSWNKPPAIPKAPPLTAEYLESCGIKFQGRWKQRFEEWSKEEQH